MSLGYPAALALMLLAAMSAIAQTHAQSPDRTSIYDRDGVRVRWHFQGGVNLVGEQNLFWDLDETFAPAADYDADTVWLEGDIKPGISFEKAITPDEVFYGKASAVLSGTLGTDAYDTGDTGRLTLEDAYLGYRVERADGFRLDLSAGRRPLKLGTGMLIENGGSSGFERGALKFGPRKAWERAAIAEFGFAGVTSRTFYLDPNETEANDNFNTLAGTELRWDGKAGGYAGLTYAHVLTSEAPYSKAAPDGIGIPSVIPDAREGLNAINFYARTEELPGNLRGLFFTTDLAYEWNDAHLRDVGVAKVDRVQ